MSHLLVTEWCAWLTASGRTDQTVSLRRHQLSRLAADVGDLLMVDGDALTEWLAGHEWAVSTLKSHCDAVRSFYSWAVATRRLVESPAATLVQVRVPARVARPALADIVEAAIARADERRRLMLLLASKAGLRRGEIARVYSDDLMRDLVGWSLIVRGKGGRERLVPLVDDVAFLLRRRGPGWAFPGDVDGHLSPARVGELVSELLPAHWTCHTLRHYFATRTYAATRDIIAVQRLLGHAKPETTMGYIGLGQDVLRGAVSWAA
ncbi:MAG: tyrosine-type recombinase/integrase [Propioniciclava sp.]|uniref:tyrosine-type recombinase/integrase n=1 Tax=Propioniciclava sp. TaxID=2038686 RepID=UPI0039E4A1C4